MLSRTRVLPLKAKQTNGFGLKWGPPRSSCATAPMTHRSRLEDEVRTRQEKPLRIEVAPQYKLSQLDHLNQILEQHKTELQKEFDLRASPKVALMFPRTFRFANQEPERERSSSTPQKNRKKDVQKKPRVMTEAQKAKENALKQASYSSERQHILQCLKSYVDVSVQVGQYELANQAVNYYRWYLKRLHKRLSAAPPEAFPREIYNQILSGCATSGDFKAAMEVKQRMLWDNVNLDATSYAYLLVTAKGKDDILGILKWMSLADVTPNDLFEKTTLTPIQITKLLFNIQQCDKHRDFKLPMLWFRPNKSCKLTARVRSSRVPFHGEPVLNADNLRKQTAEQMRREREGTIEVKSVVACDQPATDRVLFLRQQIERLENDWRKELDELFEKQLDNATNQALHLHEMSVYPYLLALDKSEFIELMVQQMRMHATSLEINGIGASLLAVQLGRKVENLYHIRTKEKRGILQARELIYDKYLNDFDPRHSTPCRELWQSLVSKNSEIGWIMENHRDYAWPQSTTSSVGRLLYSMLRQLKINVNILQQNCERREMMNALFSVYQSSAEKVTEELKAHRVLTALFSKAQVEKLRFDVTQVPMLCPPRPWCHSEDTPFLVWNASLVRVPADCGDIQMDEINSRPVQTMYPAYDALNVLGRAPWKVNKPVLDVLTKVFLSGDGDSTLSVPRDPANMVPPPASKAKSKAAARYESMTFRRERAETYSLWCDMLYKISIAHHFKDDIFFFPHNMDFRGRVYPVPPHFQHLGGDPVRGLLLFGEGQPLGEDGLWWLKLHTINLTGFKKRSSVEERVAYADEILDDIIDSAKNPLTGRKWWQKSDDPWQTLAASMELANALESPDPTQYVCHLPIHQDGSCNGLQHYAALGRDLEGALQVNLAPRDRPQDVYTGIADTVERIRQADAADGREIAQVLEGHITRKVVKQTVMTVVYGVTKYGAFHQIHRQLEARDGFPQNKANSGAAYLVDKVFQSLSQMFSATRMIQNWFTDCARLIHRTNNQPLQWTTPLGLPVVQPYFKPLKKKSPLKTDESRRLFSVPSSNPHGMKQKNGLPPNFIHSLDSAHMMLTAMYSEAAGINFVSVHDCYWTHVSSVAVMSRICREQFVALHSGPILENLAKEFKERYCHANLPEDTPEGKLNEELRTLLKKVPAKGKFDLNEVLKSTYFFS